LGAAVVGAHTIAINIASVFFMLPLSIGLAAATRIGNLVGESNVSQAQYASYVTVLVCFLGACFNTLCILLLRDGLVSLYSNDVEVIAIAVNLLFFAAVFQIPDGLQMGALGSLRGYKDTFAPMLMLIVTYWFLALPVGYMLTYHGILGNPLGASGIWIGMITGLVTFSTLIIPRLRYTSNKLIQRANPRPL
jgi:MATE family multidrug resistance protein